MRRFYFSEIPAVHEIFSVPEENTKHLTRVLRTKIGDTFEASDGTGHIFTLQVVSIDEQDVKLKVLSKTYGTEIPLLTTVLISELKNDAMDHSIGLLAEHGIQKIIPFFSERSIPKFDIKQTAKKQERRQKIADEAVKKVGGLYSCLIENSIPFKKLPEILNQYSQKIIFWEQETESSHKLSSLDFSKEQIMIIGPEGGFSEREVKEMISWGCSAYSLGTRILRAPSAAAAACVLFRYFTENPSK